MVCKSAGPEMFQASRAPKASALRGEKLWGSGRGGRGGLGWFMPLMWVSEKKSMA